MEVILRPGSDIEYPESDGEPMAENTLQFEWIVTVKENLERLFWDDPAVFVAGDLLWYPVEGNNRLRVAPDVMVAFGRPKGRRGAYLQWREGDIPPQVVFEILSPGYRHGELMNKLLFYQSHGVEEYYTYDPDTGELFGLLRTHGRLEPVSEMDGWTSPRLGIRFAVEGPGLVLYGPDGKAFRTFQELALAVEHAENRAGELAARAEAEAARAESEAARAESEAARAERLAARLRELGVSLEE